MKKIIVIVIVIAFLSIVLLLKNLYQPDQPAQPAQSNTKNYVAVVNDEGILRKDFEKKLAQTKHFFISWAKQNSANLSSLPNDVLEQMIDMKLISQFCKARQISASSQEIETRYRSSIPKDQSEKEFLDKLNEMYGSNKDDYLAILSEDILKEKLQTYTKKGVVDWLKEQRKISIIKKFI